MWILYRKHSHLRVTAGGVCGDSQERGKQVWMGEASRVSTREKVDMTKQGGESLRETDRTVTLQE